MEALTERIREIMSEKGLSSSHFADTIGIQRPAVSHIMSGRNRPSLDVVYKILDRFKDIDPTWLLTGKGSMKIRKEEKRPETAPVRQEKAEKTKDTPPPVSDQADLFKSVLNDVLGRKEEKPAVKDKKEEKAPVSSGKGIDKIVIFYSDGTCKAYTPS